MGNRGPKKLKRVVIKEELVELTGGFEKALILNQFIYWSERRKDFDRFISEEQERARTEGKKLNISKTNGWVYKSMEELAEEIMLGKSRSTISRHLKELIEAGYIESRSNPEYKWDNTKQYRVNLVKVNRDLLELGYHLEGYKFDYLYQKIAECLKRELAGEGAEEEEGGAEGEESFPRKTDREVNQEEKEEKSGERGERPEKPDMTDCALENSRASDMNDRKLNLHDRGSDLHGRRSENDRTIPDITTEFKEEEEEGGHPLKKNESKKPADKRTAKRTAETREASGAGWLEVEKLFQLVFQRQLTEFERDKFKERTDNLELIFKAIEETGISSRNRTLRYTLAVLEDYLDRGLETAAEVDSMREKYEREKQEKRKQRKKKSGDGSSSGSRGEAADRSAKSSEKRREYQDVRAMEEKFGWNS